MMGLSSLKELQNIEVFLCFESDHQSIEKQIENQSEPAGAQAYAKKEGGVDACKTKEASWEPEPDPKHEWLFSRNSDTSPHS